MHARARPRAHDAILEIAVFQKSISIFRHRSACEHADERSSEHAEPCNLHRQAIRSCSCRTHRCARAFQRSASTRGVRGRQSSRKGCSTAAPTRAFGAQLRAKASPKLETGVSRPSSAFGGSLATRQVPGCTFPVLARMCHGHVPAGTACTLVPVQSVQYGVGLCASSQASPVLAGLAASALRQRPTGTGPPRPEALPIASGLRLSGCPTY